MQRPKVSVFLALSLDGYIARENGDVSWLEPSVCGTGLALTFVGTIFFVW